MYNLSIDNFEGPLDLLLDLVRKHKIDILNIPVGKITDTYIEYLQDTELQLDSSSEFIYMASYLIFLKSKSLLPKNNKEEKEEKNFIFENEKQNFSYTLLRYKLYKNLAEHFATKNKLFDQEFKANKREQNLFLEENLQGLGNIFDLAKFAFTPNHNIMSDIGRSEGEDLKEEILYIVSRYPDGFKTKNIFKLKPLSSIKDIVAVFLASLELSRLGFIKLEIKNNAIFASTIKPLSLFDDYVLEVM